MCPIVFGFCPIDFEGDDLLSAFSFVKPYTNHSSSLASRTEEEEEEKWKLFFFEAHRRSWEWLL